MARSRSVVILVALASLPAAALAQTNKYNVTPAEHAACDSDAYRLCGESQDQDQLLVCMKARRAELTPQCSVVFVAGLKSRHMPLR